MVECKVLDRHLLEGINEKPTKFKVNSMTENRIGKFLNTGHRPYRLEQTCWLTRLVR